MKKTFTSFFVVALFLSFAVSVYGQNVARNQAELNTVLPTVEQMRAWKHKVYSGPQGTEGLELYNNGPLWNDDTPPAPIPAGAYGSELNTVALYSTLGGGWQFSAGNSLADDFTSGAAWEIDSLVFYGYQTGSGTTSTLNAIFVQIWDGPPDNAGSAVVWGDLTTNVMTYAYFTNVYRYSDTSPETTRPIMGVVVTSLGLNLPAGTYWVQISAAGTGASGPWMPPVAYMGAPYNGNAKQLIGSTWGQYFDTGAADNLEVPFKIYGRSSAPVGPGPASDPSPANGAMGLDISGITLSWTNSASTTAVDLYFGTDLALVQGLDPTVRVSTGTLISSYPLGTLTYSTPYYWRVVGSDGTSSTTNPVWSFRTIRDPANGFEDFEAGLGSWTVTNTGPAGSCVWEIDVVSNTDYTMPPAAAGNVAAANSDDCGSTGIYPMSTWLTLNTPVNLSMYGGAMLEFDMDFNQYGVDTGLVEISPDGGATWEQLAIFTVDTRAVHKMYDVTSIAAGQSEVLLRFYFFADDWNYAFAIDNVTLYGTQPSNVFEVIAGSVEAAPGNTVLVPVTFKNCSEVGAITLAIDYDPSVVSFVEAVNWSSLVPGALAQGSNGQVVIAWDAVAGFSAVEEKLVDLKFQLIGGSTPLTFDTGISEITDVIGNPLPVAYTDGAIIEVFGFDVSGTVKYRNTAFTPLVGANVALMQNGSAVDTKVTNNSGAFLFTPVLPGTYPLAVTHSGAWAGVNSTDALQLRRYVVGLQAFEQVQVKAADVNNSNTVNSTDALLIRRRVVGIDNSFARGDWAFEAPEVTVVSSAVVQDILGLCTGDVNGSNVPGVLKATPTVNFLTEGSVSAQEGKDFIIPVSISTRAVIGAVTLQFEYSEESIEIKGVSGKMEGMLFSAKDGILTIAWDDISGVAFTENEPLLNIIASVKEGKGNDITLKLISEFSEFADIEANVLQSVTVSAPEIGLALPTEFSLSQNFPNPFNPSTTVAYDLPFESKVKLEIFNTLGEVVEVLADAVQTPGRYSVEWNAKNFTSGVYFYRITAESGTKNFMQVKKLMLIK